MSGQFHAGTSPGVGVHNARIALRSRTASPAVGQRLGPQVTAGLCASASTATGRSSMPGPMGVTRPTGQVQVQAPSSGPTPRTQAQAEKYCEMVQTLSSKGLTKKEEKVRTVVNAELQAFTNRVDELKEKMDWLFAQPDHATGSPLPAFRDQFSTRPGHLTPGAASSVGGGSSYLAGTRDDALSTCFGSEAESHIEAAVDAKVAAVLEVALQKFSSFATSCMHRFQDELTRDREQKYMAIQEQILKLEMKVETLCVRVGQVSVQEPPLMADTGASPSDKGALTTIYEDGLTPAANPSGQSSPVAKPLVDAKKIEGLLSESQKKWESLQVDEVVVATEQVTVWPKASGATGEPPLAAPPSPALSQASRVSSDIQEVTFNKISLPRGGATATTSSKVAYWDEAQIGVWYNETSKLVQSCPDPESAYQFIHKRWASAEGHIPPGFRPILSQGLEEMKQKADRYFKRNSLKLSRSLSPALLGVKLGERKDFLKEPK
mmetsp:Transcript_45167/g.84544  ORF Transcript_45167/g.84544 Transcript_45167/m.84544 type:complete len:492 (+) Transcript_45167:96-1571(+)